MRELLGKQYSWTDSKFKIDWYPVSSKMCKKYKQNLQNDSPFVTEKRLLKPKIRGPSELIHMDFKLHLKDYTECCKVSLEEITSLCLSRGVYCCPISLLIIIVYGSSAVCFCNSRKPIKCYRLK